jgi:hypothetical protein
VESGDDMAIFEENLSRGASLKFSGRSLLTTSLVLRPLEVVLHGVQEK